MHTISEQELRQIQDKLQRLQNMAPDGVAGILNIELISMAADRQSCVFRANTAAWMKNAGGTLHGGMIATVLDHAMGALLYSIKDGDAFCPTIEMQASYHRPLIPGKDVLIRTRVVAKTRRLGHMAAEVVQEDAPEITCASGTSIYFLTD